jgi:HK97 family phage portal protein
MGLFARLEGSYDQLRRTRGPLDDFWYSPMSGFLGHSGVPVSPELALTISSFWAGVNFLARNLGSLPCITYRNLFDASGEPTGKRRAKDFYLYPILRWQPNSWQTALEYTEMMVGHLCTRGNFYAQIVEGAKGIQALVPRHPDRMRVDLLPSGRKLFTWRAPDGAEHKLTQDQIHHVMGFSSDGVTGLSVIQYGAQSLGAAAAADSYAARFFSQGASPSIAAIHPLTLGEDGRKNLHESITSYAAGLHNAHGVLVLEEDMKLQQIGIKPEEAQLLATREHTTREVARWLGLPTHVLADAGDAPTYASIEAFGIQLVTYAFRPLATRIEQAQVRDLVADPEEYFTEYLLDALMRGDSAARAQFYALGIQWGWFTRAEARQSENRNPIEGLDKPLTPLNMTTDAQGSKPAGAGRTDAAAARRREARRLERAHGHAVRIVEEAAARLVRKEVVAATKAATAHAASAHGWQTWLKGFYEKHAHDVARDLKVPLSVAREYAARQGLALEQRGIEAAADWEWTAVGELAALALEPRRAA